MNSEHCEPDSPEESKFEIIEELEEDEKPSGFRVFENPSVPPTHDQQTRKQIAIIILSLLSLLYVGVLVAFLFTDLEESKFTAAIAGISGVQALAAAAVGFYYGSHKTD